MNDPTAWLIALAFFAPLHYLGPLLTGLLTGDEDAATRKRLLTRLAIDCTLTMGLAFVIAMLTFATRPGIAIGILIAAMFTPYAHLWVHRRRQAAH